MIVVVVALVVVLVLWRVRRMAKKRSLVAGLVAERPAFHVAPPSGRMGRLRDGAL